MTNKVLLAIVVVYLATSAQADDPTYCTRYGTEQYDCNPHNCNCETCHTCGCEAKLGSCSHDSCGNSGCWCSFFHCRCCYESDCRSNCNCDTCYDTCQRNDCLESISYNISGIAPNFGPHTGGTEVEIIGGSDFIATHHVQCRFGATVVNGDVVGTKKIRCITPPVTNLPEGSSQVVPIEVSLDQGDAWTVNNVIFTYYNCPAGSECFENGACTACCPQGYVGQNCDQLCPGNSTATPCENNGQCYFDNVAPELGAQCQCSPGYWGNSCDGVCPGPPGSPCHDNGICTDDGLCSCLHGYAGDECDVECPGGAVNPCSEKGRCSQHDNKCHCIPGYWGDACQNTCPGMTDENKPCSNHGTCDSAGVCHCDPGHDGDGCEQKYCVNACNHNGACEEGECRCYRGWKGSYCDEPDGAGVIEFGTTEVIVEESVADVHIPLIRRHGSNGQISVAVTDTAGQALPSSDYFSLSERISWNDLDNQTQFVTVVLIDDPTTEPTESFTISLSEPTGGATLADESLTSVNITILHNDNDISKNLNVEVEVQQLHSFNSLATDAARAEYIAAFTSELADVTSALSSSQFFVEYIEPVQSGNAIRVTFKILSSSAEGAATPHAIATEILVLVSNPNSELYDSDAHPTIAETDITYQPSISSSTGDGTQTDPDRSLPTTTVIILCVTIPTIVLGLIVLCYYKRKPIVDWLLWKLGGFRFNRFVADEEEEMEDDAGLPTGIGGLAGMDALAGNKSVFRGINDTDL